MGIEKNVRFGERVTICGLSMLRWPRVGGDQRRVSTALLESAVLGPDFGDNPYLL